MPDRAWLQTLAAIAGWLLLALLVGFALDAIWPALAIALAITLTWQFRHWHRLLTALRDRRQVREAPSWGLQDELHTLLRRRERDHLRSRRRLHRLLHAFRQAAAALPDGVLVLGPERRIEWFNPAAGELLGLRRPRDIGLPLPHLLRAPRVLDWFDGGAVEPLFDLPAPDAPERRLSLRLIDYTDRQKLLIVRDISKLMQLEQVRRDFVANVSHELRTPLTVVHGYLDLLDPEPGSDWEGPIGEMRRQSQRMTRLVEDLLTLSRLEAQEHLAAEPVPILPLLTSLRREAEALSAGQHRVSVDDRTDCDLLGAEQELHGAFSNLVANAVRYTPAGGSVTIRFERTTDGGARLVVEDSGPGIPAEHLSRLTERFYRVSTSRSRASGGTGLGLAIVKHVLLLHRARLVIESEVGRGSRFSCVFDPQHVIPRTAAG